MTDNAKIEQRGAGIHIVSEANGNLSREAVVVGEITPDTVDGENAKVLTGTILGQVTLAGTAVASGITGTGNGTITVDATAPIGPDAKAGVYTFQLVGEEGNAGAFAVTDPDGVALAPLLVGVTYDTAHLKLAVADGSTDFATGDKFTVTVAAAAADDQVYLPLDLDARNGVQHAAAILFGPVNASAGDVAAVVTVRESEVLGSELVYPDGATDDEVAAINAELVALGIIVR